MQGHPRNLLVGEFAQACLELHWSGPTEHSLVEHVAERSGWLHSGQAPSMGATPTCMHTDTTRQRVHIGADLLIRVRSARLPSGLLTRKHPSRALRTGSSWTIRSTTLTGVPQAGQPEIIAFSGKVAAQAGQVGISEGGSLVRSGMAWSSSGLEVLGLEEVRTRRAGQRHGPGRRPLRGTGRLRTLLPALYADRWARPGRRCCELQVGRGLGRRRWGFLGAAKPAAWVESS